MCATMSHGPAHGSTIRNAPSTWSNTRSIHGSMDDLTNLRWRTHARQGPCPWSDHTPDHTLHQLPTLPASPRWTQHCTPPWTIPGPYLGPCLGPCAENPAVALLDHVLDHVPDHTLDPASDHVFHPVLDATHGPGVWPPAGSHPGRGQILDQVSDHLPGRLHSADTSRTRCRTTC